MPAGLAEALAAEVGGQVVVVTLYTGSLGPGGSGAETYIGMQRLNAERIAAALSS
jgi:zinc/manganese transport system substrate-binding protein